MEKSRLFVSHLWEREEIVKIVRGHKAAFDEAKASGSQRHGMMLYCDSGRTERFSSYVVITCTDTSDCVVLVFVCVCERVCVCVYVGGWWWWWGGGKHQAVAD